MCMFGGGKDPVAPAIPAPPPPVPQPKATQDETRRAREAERGRAALASGRDSTILTGPLGDQSQANTRGKTLLGA